MSGVRSARLVELDLPEFGMPESQPELPAGIYLARVDRLRERMAAVGYDRLVVYADREHSANLSYLSGFDPRFEEAVLILDGDRPPLCLVGNECVGLARAAPLEMRVELYQNLSLPGQPRHRSRPFDEVLSGEGIGTGSRVGLVGWKSYGDRFIHDAPSWLVDALRSAVGVGGTVDNAVDLLIHPAVGLRVINEVEQLAFFEWAASHTSQGVRRLIHGLRPGTTEREAVQLLEWNGMPLSCHLMLTAGERASLGLLSPGDRPIARGDRFTVAFGIWGALNCRAGFVVESAAELPSSISDYLDRLVVPYFEAVVEWLEALRIGQRGAVLHEIVDRRLGDPFFGIFLNPGHQIHLDEWVNSPIYPDSDVRLESGMAFQVDIIPATGTPYFTTNIEDGVALANGDLRDEFAARYPDAWRRIEARRRFMIEQLGIRLHPDVLPFSNIPSYLPPFLLAPTKAMAMR